MGEKYETVDEAVAGEIVAVTGLSSTFPGQGIGEGMQSNMPILEPVLNYRMILPDDVNPAAFMEILKQLEEEDPQLYIDKLDQVILDSAIKASKARYLSKDTGGINEDEFNDWTKEVVHYTGNPDDILPLQSVVPPTQCINVKE